MHSAVLSKVSHQQIRARTRAGKSGCQKLHGDNAILYAATAAATAYNAIGIARFLLSAVLPSANPVQCIEQRHSSCTAAKTSMVHHRRIQFLIFILIYAPYIFLMLCFGAMRE